MKLYLAGIKSYQLDVGLECSVFSDPQLERTIQGIKRDHREPDRRARMPLTRPLLLQLLTSLNTTDYNHLVLKAAFTLAFAAFLRVGEFTYKAADTASGPSFPSWFLTKSSVRLIGATHMELTLPSSKTDPFRKGIKLTIAASHDSGCPVRAMTTFLTADTHRHQLSPLFCIGQVAQLPFTREYVVERLQQLAIAAGLGLGPWKGHSSRRGAAAWAAEVGISEREIQTLGQWRSDAYKAYIQYSQEEQVSLSHRFQVNHPQQRQRSAACLRMGTRG